MNYEILGNTDAYLHAHLFPRYDWEPRARIVTELQALTAEWSQQPPS